MDLAEVPEKDLSASRTPPPMGKWHPGTISSAEPTSSSKGSSMIKAQVTLTGEGYEGYTIYHNFMTDGSTKGGGFTKKQLMGCGIDVSKPQPDEQVAEQLLGKEVFVQVRHEVIKDKDEATQQYTKIRYYQDESGKDVPAKKAVAVAFSLYDPTGEKKQEAAPPKEEAPARTDAPAGGAPAKPTPPWLAKKTVANAPK